MQCVFGFPMDSTSVTKVLEALRTDMKSVTPHEKKLNALYLVVNSIDVELMKDSLKAIEK